MSTITVCMIVYNEEKNLKRCLKSVKGFADEIIAVDTRSTDNSVSVLKEFGAKVFEYEWNSDFAAARNYGISKASGDYILFLDADEKLEIHNKRALKKYLDTCWYDLFPVSIVNFYGRNPPDIRRCHFSGGLRLARNSSSLRFIGKIHERLNTAGKTVAPAEAARLLRILHYGYTKSAYKRKNGRNLSIITHDENAADDAWTHYYLAAEYYRQGQADHAYYEVNLSIILFLGKKLKPPPWTYKLKYDLLIAKHNFADAYNGIIKAVTLYPDYVDLQFYKGILQYANCEYENAKKTFSYCLVLGEQNLSYLILSGAGSFLALHYLGLCCQKLNRPEEAVEALSQADALYPGLSEEPELKHYLPQHAANRHT